MTRVRKLTGDAGLAIARTVQRLLGLLVGMALLLSVGMAPIAHASEQLCLPGNEAAAALSGHVDGDADQAPDTERAFPTTMPVAMATISRIAGSARRPRRLRSCRHASSPPGLPS